MLQTTDPHIITNQIDSLHTQVQIIDTTVTHIHVYDTIVTHVYDTIQPDLITVYDKMFTAQDNNFDNILILITVIVTVLIVVFTAFNFLVAKKLFRLEFRKMLKAERENIKKAALEDVEKELHFMKGESARLFALKCDEEDYFLPSKINWWLEALRGYSLSNETDLQRLCIRNILSALKASIDKKDIFFKHFKPAGVNFDDFRTNCDFIHNSVSEKEQIIKLLDELENHYKGLEREIQDAEVVE